MSNPKYVTFINDLEAVLGRYDSKSIKTAIGDSINNNRVPTIRQVVRFLGGNNTAERTKKLSESLNNAYDLLRDDIAAFRSLKNYRSDGFDIYEFVDTYYAMVVKGKNTSLRRAVSRVLV